MTKDCSEGSHKWGKESPFPGKNFLNLRGCEHCQVLGRREGTKMIIVTCVTAGCKRPATTLSNAGRPVCTAHSPGDLL